MPQTDITITHDGPITYATYPNGTVVPWHRGTASREAVEAAIRRDVAQCIEYGVWGRYWRRGEDDACLT